MDDYHMDGGDAVIDPNNSAVIYTGGVVVGSGTYVMTVSKSTDDGATWHRDTLTTTYSKCNTLAIDPGNSNIVYAGGWSAKLFKSTNAGNTWSAAATGLSGDINDIVIGSTKGSTIYVASTSGVFKSTDAGLNWTNTGCTNVNALLINPGNENEIYAATNTGVYKSTTGGGGWTAMNTGLPNIKATTLGINPNNYLFVGTEGGSLYRWNILIVAEEAGTDNPLLALSFTPNPFSQTVAINTSVWQDGLTLRIYDTGGRLVKDLTAGLSKNNPVITWDGTDRKGARLPAGIYFCRAQGPDQTLNNKLIMLK